MMTFSTDLEIFWVGNAASYSHIVSANLSQRLRVQASLHFLLRHIRKPAVSNTIIR